MGFFQQLGSWFGRGSTSTAAAAADALPPRPRDDYDERIRTGPSGIPFPTFLPYFDDRMRETAAMRAQYWPMLACPDVKAPLMGKIFGVAAQDLQIHPWKKKDKAAEEQAEFVKWTLTESLEGGVVELAWDVLVHACVAGVSVSEKVWERPDPQCEYPDKVRLVDLKPKDPDRDIVLLLDEYRNIVGIRGMRYNASEVYSPDDFLIYTHMSIYGSPTGTSDLRAAYSSFWMLDTVKKLRAMGAEKRALPIIVGEYPDVNKKDSLEAALRQAKSSNWLAVPQNVKVQILEIAGSSNDYFQSFAKDLREEIQISIAGSLLSSMQGGEGVQRGSSAIHEKTADIRKWYLSECLANRLNSRKNGLVKDIVDRNYPPIGGYPRATFGGVDEAQMTSKLTLATGLARDLGLPLSKEQAYEEFSFRPPMDASDALTAPQGGGGAPGGSPGATMSSNDVPYSESPDDAEAFCGGKGGTPGPCKDPSKTGATLGKTEAKLAKAEAAHSGAKTLKQKQAALGRLAKAAAAHRAALEKHEIAKAVNEKHEAVKKGAKTNPAKSAAKRPESKKPAEKQKPDQPEPAKQEKPANKSTAKAGFPPDDHPRARPPEELKQLHSDLAKKMPELSEKEMDAFGDYAAGSYSTINKGLRDGTTPTKGAAAAKTIQAALDAAPVLDKPITTYRGVRVSKAEEQHLIQQAEALSKSGGTMEMKGFTSTSLDYKIANQFSKGGESSVLFEVSARKGLYLGESAGNSHEKEFLLQHGTKFKVAGIKEVPIAEGVTKRVIQLEQVV